MDLAVALVKESPARWSALSNEEDFDPLWAKAGPQRFDIRVGHDGSLASLASPTDNVRKQLEGPEPELINVCWLRVWWTCVEGHRDSGLTL